MAGNSVTRFNQIGRFGVLLKHALGWPLYLLALAIPKSERVWIFGGWGGIAFSDNGKYLLIEAKKLYPEHRLVWIAKSRGLVIEMTAAGFHAVWCWGLLGIFTQLRASKAFFTHGINYDFFAPVASCVPVKVQMGHGTPIKRIGYDDEFRISGRRRRWLPLKEAVLPWTRETYDVVISSSRRVSDTLRSAFRCDTILPLGYPRNDALKRSEIRLRRRIQKLIYMPTFRGQHEAADSSKRTSDFLRRSGFDVDAVSELLAREGLQLALRLHPSNRPDPELVEKIGSTSNISFENASDIYVSLNEYDLLISDYSSVILDFLLTGKPIITATFDLEEYRSQSRSLYYSLEEFALTPEVRNWREILEFAGRLNRDWISEAYLLRYEQMQRKFNEYVHGSAARRILSAV